MRELEDDEDPHPLTMDGIPAAGQRFSMMRIESGLTVEVENSVDAPGSSEVE